MGRAFGAELARLGVVLLAPLGLEGRAFCGVLALSASYTFGVMELGPEKRSFAALRAHGSTMGLRTATISPTMPPISTRVWLWVRGGLLMPVAQQKSVGVDCS